MKTIKITLLVIFTMALIGLIIVSDIFDRGQYYSVFTPTEEQMEFFMGKTTEEQVTAFEKNFGNKKYAFPREEVAKVKLFKNTLLIGRLTLKKLSEADKSEVIYFFNNPDNFHWSETTWGIEESEYIFRFYNRQNKEIGKIWLCLEDCGMTKSIPFSPNMKYGGLSQMGIERIKKLLNRILAE